MPLLLPVRLSSVRIGLLGGSFDPPHMGHVHISIEAIKRLELSRLIWLISPQNPMKSPAMFTLQKRMKLARRIVHHSKIIISDIENYLPTAYTADTIKILRNMHPNYQFIWIMGGDNMLQIHKWCNWRYIFDNVFVAVFDRADYTYKILYSKAAQYYRNCCIGSDDRLLSISNGSWCFFRIKKHCGSSTVIRNGYIASEL